MHKQGLVLGVFGVDSEKEGGEALVNREFVFVVFSITKSSGVSVFFRVASIRVFFEIKSRYTTVFGGLRLFSVDNKKREA
jgi:hypothetical protein